MKNYKTLIQTATDDLEAHLESIDEKLESLFTRTVTDSDSDATELRLIKEERLSTQKCLQICSQLTDHINQIQLSDSESLPERVTKEGLQECQDNLRITAAKLEKYMHDIIDRLMTKSRTTMTSEEEVADLARLREEWETARQSLDIYSKADNHLKQNISIIENYATGDETIQFLVSTNGKTIHGKNRGFGSKQRQLGGHLSDLSLQQISRDISHMSSHSMGENSPSPRDNTASTPADVVEKASSSDFRERYGKGFKLAPNSSPDTIMSNEQPAEAEGDCARKR